MDKEKELLSARKTVDHDQWMTAVQFAERKEAEEEMRRTNFKKSFIKPENYDCME